MEELLARTRESDAEVARRAVGAQPRASPTPTGHRASRTRRTRTERRRFPRSARARGRRRLRSLGSTGPITRSVVGRRPLTDRRRCARRRRRRHAAGPRAARRRRARQRARARHRPVAARRAGAGGLRDARRRCPRPCGPSTCSGLVRARGRARRAGRSWWRATSTSPPGSARWRAALDAARVSIMIDHHVTNPGFGDVQLLDPTRRGHRRARPPRCCWRWAWSSTSTSPAASTRARHRHPRLPRRPGRPPTGSRPS